MGEIIPRTGAALLTRNPRITLEAGKGGEALRPDLWEKNVFNTASHTMASLRFAGMRTRVAQQPAFLLQRSLATRPSPGPNPSSEPPLFHIPPPPPRDFPPILQRLKPLVPFLIGWSAITSLALHLLHARRDAAEDMARKDAQVSVLEGLVKRAQRGELGEDEAQRELEMVGLRERSGQGDAEIPERDALDVSWWEVLLGRQRGRKTVEEQEEAARAEWAAGAFPCLLFGVDMQLTMPACSRQRSHSSRRKGAGSPAAKAQDGRGAAARSVRISIRHVMTCLRCGAPGANWQ